MIKSTLEVIKWNFVTIFKEGTRVYDKAELLTYLEAQPYMRLLQEGAIKVAKYHNTVINMDADFIFNTKSIVSNIQRLDPKYLDLNIYVEFDVLNNTYKVSKIVDMIEVICKDLVFLFIMSILKMFLLLKDHF